MAIAGAFMIGLGFRPFHAAALNLIANTAPVAWGAIGTPVHALAAVSGLPESDHQRDDRPHSAVHRDHRSLLAGAHDGRLGGNFRSVPRDSRGRRFVFRSRNSCGRIIVDSNLVDIVSGCGFHRRAPLFSFAFWKPKKIWRFDYDKPEGAAARQSRLTGDVADDMGGEWPAKEYDGYVAPKKYPASDSAESLDAVRDSFRFRSAAGACRK